MCFVEEMMATFRHPVGKTTVSGYILVKVQDEGFFEPDPLDGERIVKIRYDEGQFVEARLIRSGGKDPRLKLSYAGKGAEPFRAWLRRRFPARRGQRKPRGVLIVERLSASLFEVETESVRQALTDLMTPGTRHYLAGARPVSILHPAMIDLEESLRQMPVKPSSNVRRIRSDIHTALEKLGWSAVDSVGAGLSLPAEMRKNQAQLHSVFEAGELFSAMLSIAVAFELGEIDLGVVMVADSKLTRRIRYSKGEQPASLSRVLREIELLPFLLRGPVCLIGLSSREEVR